MTIRILGVLLLVFIIIAIVELVTISYLLDNRSTWVKLAQETHDIAAMCVVQVQGDVDQLEARFIQIMGLGTVEMRRGEDHDR